MTAVFTVYTASAPGTWTAAGTLDHVTTARQPYRMNEISTGSLSLPATSAGKSLIAYDRLIIGVDDGRELCAFVVASIKIRINKSGTFIDVSGPDLLHELTRYNLGTDVIDDGAGGKAANDLAQIIAYMPGALGWSVVNAELPTSAQTGTRFGTYLPSSGESVFQMLRRCAEQSGEAFRIQPITSPTDRAVGWMSFPPASSGGTFSLPANPLLVEGEDWRGVIISCQEDTDYKNLTTSAYVFGAGMGTTRLTIADAQGYAPVPYGWSVDWTNSLIVTSAEAGYRTAHRKQKSFGSIRAQSDTTADKRSAAVALFNAAVAWLTEQSQPVKSWRLEVVIKSNVRPGSLSTLDPLTIYGQTVLTGGTYYIKDVDHTYNNGKRVTSLALAERYTAPRPPDDGTAVARQLEQVDQTIRHASAAGSSGSGTLQQHDALLGRTDPQNHTQYLLTNGGRALTGNMPFLDGVKIDGMDPSAHVAQPSAHHNWPLLDADIPASISRVTQLHSAVTLAADSDPILTLVDQQLRLGDVTTQAEFNAKVNQDLRTSASPAFVDLTLTGGLLLRDRVTSTLYRLFVSSGKVYLETVS
jgi:hypothetical protein